MKTLNGEYVEYKGYGLQYIRKFEGNQCNTIALIGIPKQDPFYDVNVFAVPFEGRNVVFSRDDTFRGPKKSKQYAWFSRYFREYDLAASILHVAVDWRLSQYTHVEFYADNEPYLVVSSRSHIDLDIDKIIYSGPKTIVLWNDGTKTIVSCGEDDEFDEYSGFCAAFAKKLIGSTSKIKRVIKQKSVNYRDTEIKTPNIYGRTLYSMDDITEAFRKLNDTLSHGIHKEETDNDKK